MKCKETQDLLSSFYDGELSLENSSNVEAHLAQCSECQQRLTRFNQLSKLTNDINSPVPSEQMWNQIEIQLDHCSKEEHLNTTVDKQTSDEQSFRLKKIILAATILIAVGIGWFSYHSWFAHGQHHQFTTEFGQYLDEFHQNPDAAQQILLAKYENEQIDPQNSIQQVGYRPAVADGLPDGYRIESTHFMKMPCCDCVQSLCKRSDGSTLAIFEHNTEETTQWFGDKPGITTRCNNKQCCLVELDDQIAASWKRGNRYITLIGVRDVTEVNEMVAWLDRKTEH